jgi:hypothetical protein
MKKRLLVLLCFGLVGTTKAQITIAAADMPVAGDTLRYSIAVDTSFNLGLGNTGANITWDYSGLNRVAQGRDDYKSASQVNITYALTISPNAYGYKIADSIPGSPVPITDVYTFFSKKTSPSRFVAEAFAANISGFPTPINYSNEDEWYFFPLDFNDFDSSTFRLAYSLTGIGSFSQQGTRKTTVDGWGTIQTPFYTTPANCIRIRSEVEEVDSISFSGQSTGIPRHTIDYKWLVNGQHYPALWIVTNVIAGQEVPSFVRYKDSYHAPTLSVGQSAASVRVLEAYPNPAADGIVTLNVPSGWTTYSVELFDLQGRLAMHTANTAKINMLGLTSGQYIIRVTAGNEIGYVRVTR